MRETDTARFFSYLFLIVFSVQGLFLAFVVPTFQGADEINHIYRADAVARGALVSRMNPDGQPGGDADRSIETVARFFANMPYHSDQKLSLEARAAARAIPWSGELHSVSYWNTAIYSPVLYVPSAAGILAGRLAGLGTVDSLTLGRLANASAYLLLGLVAVRLSGSASPLTFTVLTLPMSAFLAAYITQDGMIIACTALAAALLGASLRGGPETRSAWRFFALVASLTLVAIAKAPYLPFLLILPFAPFGGRLRRWAVTILAAAIALGWHAYAVIALPVAWSRAIGVGTIDPGQQIQFLVSNPAAIFTIAEKTLGALGVYYLHQIIGVLGWLDAPVPRWFMMLGWAALVAAILYHVAASPPRTYGSRALAPSAAIAIALSDVAIFGTLFLTVNAVGSMTLNGVQGRYFLPSLFLVPLALPSFGFALSRGYQEVAARIMFCGYACVCVVITITTVLGRYYLF